MKKNVIYLFMLICSFSMFVSCKDDSDHYTPPSAFSVSDIDLWKNSAIVSVQELPENATIQYRLKGETDWKNTVKNSDGKFAIGTTWTEGLNDAGLKIYNVDSKSGVFAGHTYELRAVEGEQEIGNGSFTTAVGDSIPNGHMTNWSTKQMATQQVPYPNIEGQGFWDSGNNAFAQMFNTPLCAQGADDEVGVAVLKSTKILGQIFAAGNMFTGEFVQPGMTGDANFGAVYSYTARPVALKIRYKATIDTCDAAGTHDPIGQECLKKLDEARVLVAITDWTERHTVTSGMTDPTPTIWDPIKQDSTAEGPILAYASAFISESTDEWVELTLPISWYVREAEKPTNEYSLVISFATSARGDYLTGSSKNRFCVDDIQWVY